MGNDSAPTPRRHSHDFAKLLRSARHRLRSIYLPGYRQWAEKQDMAAAKAGDAPSTKGPHWGLVGGALSSRYLL